jgi:hypothetical protein
MSAIGSELGALTRPRAGLLDHHTLMPIDIVNPGRSWTSYFERPIRRLNRTVLDRAPRPRQRTKRGDPARMPFLAMACVYV